MLYFHLECGVLFHCVIQYFPLNKINDYVLYKITSLIFAVLSKIFNLNANEMTGAGVPWILLLIDRTHVPHPISKVHRNCTCIVPCKMGLMTPN